MKPLQTQNGYGLLGLLLTVLIIGILMRLVLVQVQSSLKQNPAAPQRVNVEQLKKDLNDTMKKHEADLNNYEKSLQGL